MSGAGGILFVTCLQPSLVDLTFVCTNCFRPFAVGFYLEIIIVALMEREKTME